jgi:tetratricopeptide (TPR) repeat protein
MHALERLSRLLDYLTQDPRNPSLLSDIADTQLQLGEWRSARSTLSQLLDIRPADALTRYRLAVAERADGNLREALSWLRDLANEGHAQPALQQELARCHAQLGDWANTLASLQDLNPSKLPTDEHDAVRLLRVRAYHQLALLEEALAEASQWRAERGGEMPLNGQAAIVTLLIDAEKLQDATQMLAQVPLEALTANPEMAAAAGFIALGQGQHETALAHFAISSELDPELGRAKLGTALTFAAQGHLARALQAMEDAVGASPDHLGAWHALAWMQLLTKDVDAAARTFRTALERDDTFGESHGGLALVAALQGNRGTCEQHLHRASKLDPDSTNAMIALTVLQRGPGALDAPLLEQALTRFMGTAARRNPALREMLARFVRAAA